MPIKVTCECGKVTNVPDAYAGRTGKCPACKRPVKVPMLQSAAIAQPAVPEPNYHSRASVQHEPERESAAAPDAEPQYQVEHDDAQDAPTEQSSAQDPAGYEMSDSSAHSAAQQLQYVAPGQGGGGPIAPPPADMIQIPMMLPEKLRQPNCPPVFLVMSTAGSDVHTNFDASPVLQAFVEMFAKKLKKKFDVRLDPPTPGNDATMVFVRVIRIQQGNRFLRYLLAWLSMLFGAHTSFEIDGNVQGPSKEARPFTFKHKSVLSFNFGGNSLNLLKLDAKVVAKKVAALTKKAT